MKKKKTFLNSGGIYRLCKKKTIREKEEIKNKNYYTKKKRGKNSEAYYIKELNPLNLLS